MNPSRSLLAPLSAATAAVLFAIVGALAHAGALEEGRWQRLTVASLDATGTVLRAGPFEWQIAGIVPFDDCPVDLQLRARALFLQEVFYVREGDARVFAPRDGEVVDVAQWMAAEGLARAKPGAPAAVLAAGERAKAGRLGAWSTCGNPTTPAPSPFGGSTVWDRVGSQTGVSSRLLYAIATGESGLRGSPHPWTLNVRGKGYYFATREAAWKHARDLVDAGEEWFDVGLMQIHWRIHKGRFRSLWEALDAETNVTVGAAILKENFVRTKSVTMAVAHYHSADPNKNTRYVRTVAELLDRQAKKLKATF